MAGVKELEAELAQARKDIERLASMAADSASSRAVGLASGIETALGELSEEAQAVFDRAKTEGARARANVEEQIQGNPMTSAGIAFAAGFVLAMLLARR